MRPQARATWPHARARRDALESAGRTDISVSSGEWIRRSLLVITSEGAIESTFDFNMGITTRMRRHGQLKSKVDVAIDLHNVRRFDKKPGPELVRGGGRGGQGKHDKGAVQDVRDRPVAGKRPEAYRGHGCLARATTMPRSCAPCWTPAPGRIRVGTVMVDRGFFSRGAIEVPDVWGRVADVVPQHGICQGALADFVAGRRTRVSDAVITSSDRQESPYTMSIVPRRARRKKRDADGCADEEP